MLPGGAIVDFGRADVWVEGYSLFRVGLISRDASDAVANFKEQLVWTHCQWDQPAIAS